MNTAVVRPAEPADLDAVVRTFLACWRESYADLLPPDVRDLYTVDTAGELWRRAPIAELVVADVPGHGVLGVTRFGADRTNPARGHVFSLYVHPGSQGLGLGRALLDAAVQRLREEGYPEATLWVFADNAAARDFYRSQGWTPDGATRVEPAYRLPEVRLTRALRPALRQIWSPAVRPFELDGRPVPGSAAIEVPAPRRWLFVSGQCSFRDGEFVGDGDIAVQVRQALANLTSLLAAAGATTADVVKLTAWVTHADHVAEYARIRTEYFTATPPASTTVVGQLVDPRMLIEVEAIAALYS